MSKKLTKKSLISSVEQALNEEIQLVNNVVKPKSRGSINHTLKVSTPKARVIENVDVDVDVETTTKAVNKVTKKVTKKIQKAKRKKEIEEQDRLYKEYLKTEREKQKQERDKIKALEKEDKQRQKEIRKEKTNMYRDLFKEVEKRDNQAYKDYIKQEKELQKQEQDKLKAIQREEKRKEKEYRKEMIEMYKDLFKQVNTPQNKIKEDIKPLTEVNITQNDVKNIEKMFNSKGREVNLKEIDKLSEREELLKIVNNLITKVNNKGINFKRAGLDDVYKNRLEELVGDKKYLLTESGNLSKNKDVLNDLSDAQLHNYRRALEKLQTSHKYSTPSAFKKFAKLQKTKMDNAVKRVLGDEIYDKIGIYNVDDLYSYLNDARANGKEYYSSEQAIREFFHELLEDDTEEMELLERDMRRSIEAYERRANFSVSNKRGGNMR